MKNVLLTLDVEEFDLPKEFGCNISESEMYEISMNGLSNITSMLNKHDIKATFFVTANFAKKYPKILINLSEEGHEIASHGYDHSFSNQSLNQIKKAKQEKEEIIGRMIIGYRAPRFNTMHLKDLPSLGFFYDSSIHPTFIPGRYMNLFKKRGVHKIGNMIEIPPSVLPFVRLPIFWLAFKNFPEFYPKIFTKINFIFSDYLMLVFHSWEFANLENIKIPKFIKRKNGEEMLNLLEDYIIFSKKYHFDTVGNFLKIRQ